MGTAMDANQTNPFQIFARLLDGKTATLRFRIPQVSCHVIKERIFQITGIPVYSQCLVHGGLQLSDKAVVSTPDTTVYLLLRLRGGKGGFGSLLRGAATKAGQKKTNNFDACRDMSGRRLRHVNAEKRLEEWRAEEDERKLERIAEDFIKQKAKENGKRGCVNLEVDKYVEKYREVAGQCVAEVEEAVREACRSNVLEKRKKKALVGLEGGEATKKLKIWMGKRTLGESDSEVTDEDSSDDDDSDEENQKSIVLNNGNHSDISKEADESSDSVTGMKQDGQCSNGASCDSGSGSAEETDGAQEQFLGSSPGAGDIPDGGENIVKLKVPEENMVGAASYSQSLQAAPKETQVIEMKQVIIEAHDKPNEDSSTGKISNVNVEQPLNFDNFISAADLEVLGMERLKTELQVRGLKCGGTLQERAARLFLLKFSPLEKIPRKHLAKK